MREIVVDTETTGLSHRHGDRIVEVGCVELVNHIPTNKTLQFYCKVDKQMSDSAQNISGITNNFLKKQKTFEENHLRLLKFIDEDTLIIHNADFDIGFLNHELSLLNKGPIANPVIDTVELARKTLNTRIANLDYLCRRFNIDLSERNLHGALLDSRLLAEVYLELRGGKQFSMDLGLNTRKENITKTKISKKTNELKKIQNNNQDALLHREMLKKINDPIWKKYNY